LSIALCSRLAIALWLHGRAITLGRRLLWHSTRGHGLWHATISTIARHRWLATSTGGLLAWLSGWSATRSKLLHQVVLLEVATELVVVDALLETNENVVQLQVELGALLQLHGELILHDDGLVDLREELVLGWVVTHRVDELVKLWAQLLNHSSTLLSLLLERLVLCKVFNVLSLEPLEDFTLVRSSRVDLHELLNCVKVVMQGDTIVHHLLLALADSLENGKLLLNTHD